MNLIHSGQVSEEQLLATRFDLMLAASGFESRATHAYTKTSIDGKPERVAFCFQDRSNAQREDNDRFFDRNSFTLIDAQGSHCSKIFNAVRSRIESTQGARIRIFVDYSSMTRAWYAAVLKGVTAVRNKKSIECYFCYSPAKFVPPSETTPNTEVGPLPGFCGLETPDRPTALIVGLGYERDRALGLVEYVDPATCFGLITDPPIDPKYLNVVLENNSAFLDCIQTQLIRHPLNDLQLMSSVLLSLYSGLRDDYRLILAPLGVKPFSLICLLLSLRFGDVDVWRVTSGIKAGTPERTALGPVLTLKVVFSSTTFGESEFQEMSEVPDL